MTGQLRAEFAKQRSTRTTAGLLAAMLVLVLFAVLLHGLGISEENVRSDADQLTVVFGRGEFLGTLFAGLLGALAVTSEYRYGTIRPTFLVTPWRWRVVAAKAMTSALFGAGFGLAACAAAALAGTLALEARSIDISLTTGDYALLIAGGTAAGALWATIGVGVGAIMRNQVSTLIGICAWLLFVEALLVGDVADVGEVGRFAPGALGMAASGQDPDTLVAPGTGVTLLAAYAIGLTFAGWLATERRDVI